MPDQVLLTLTDIEITTRLARLGAKTFQISSIGSVSVHHTRQLNSIAVALIVAGVVCFAVALNLNSSNSPHIVPVLLGGVAALIAGLLVQQIWPKRIYTLTLRIASNETYRLTSQDRDRLFQIRDAIENAFARRI